MIEKEQVKFDISNVLITLLILSSFFPFIQIIPLGTDSQPYALMVSMIIFPFYFNRKINLSLFLLFVIAVFSIAVLFFSKIDFGSIRSLINYVSLFIISYVTYKCFKFTNGLNYKIFKNVVYTWFAIGTIQTFVYSNFLSFLLPRGSSEATIESGRGVVCLAPEPTFYGIVCVLFIMIGYLNFRDYKGIKKIYTLLLIQIFIYARSSLVILMIFACLLIYAFASFMAKKKNKFKIIFTVSLFLFILISVINNYSEQISGIRIGKILTLMLENPDKLVLIDDSINERFVHLFFPLYGFIENWGLPHGYSQYADFMATCYNNPDLNYLVTDYTLKNKIIRIMSGWGSILFELGAVGLLLLYVIIKNLKIVIEGKMRYVIILGFIGLLANAVSFATALLPFIIGNIIYLAEKKKENLYENSI